MDKLDIDWSSLNYSLNETMRLATCDLKKTLINGISVYMPSSRAKIMNDKVENIKSEISALYAILQGIQSGFPSLPPLPLICLEGLPGCGKTTQLGLIQNIEDDSLGRTYVVDLPSKLNVGRALSELYMNQKTFLSVAKELPWLNLFLILTNLHLEVLKAQKRGNDLVLMSRGIFSTFFFNRDFFLSHGLTSQEATEILYFFLNGFFIPSAVIYIDIPIEVAHARVLKRNRIPLREIDSYEGLTENLRFFNEAFELLGNQTPILKIDGNRSQEIVANDIAVIIKRHIKR